MRARAVQLRSQAVPARGSDTSIALIAAPGPSKPIVEALAGEALDFARFDGPEELLARASEYSPSVLLIWIEDTAWRRLACIEPLTRSCDQAPAIVICSSLDRWRVRAALAAGAAGVVLWDDLDTTLQPCLQAVRAGQICVPRKHWRQIDPPALSTREKQILGLVVMGYSNGQIAHQLFLAESTVKSHLSSAFGKLGVRSRNEAVSLIVDPERGLGMGILALGGEPLDSAPVPAQ